MSGSVESHSRGAVAVVASSCVHTDTSNAKISSIGIALINVFTGTGVRVMPVARRTGTLMTARCVAAESILAK